MSLAEKVVGLIADILVALANKDHAAIDRAQRALIADAADAATDEVLRRALKK